jgi:hypothetical protein
MATKIIPPRSEGGRVLKLRYAAVIRAADRWRGLTVGEFEQRQRRAIREELGDDPRTGPRADARCYFRTGCK